MKKKRVDIADTLVGAADKLPDLVFTATGELVSGKPSKPTAPKVTPKVTPKGARRKKRPAG